MVASHHPLHESRAGWRQSAGRNHGAGTVFEPDSTEENTPMKTFISLSAALVTAAMLTTAANAASPQTSAPKTTPPASMQTADTSMVVSHGYAHVRKEANTKSQILATL